MPRIYFISSLSRWLDRGRPQQWDFPRRKPKEAEWISPSMDKALGNGTFTNILTNRGASMRSCVRSCRTPPTSASGIGKPTYFATPLSVRLNAASALYEVSLDSWRSSSSCLQLGPTSVRSCSRRGRTTPTSASDGAKPIHFAAPLSVRLNAASAHYEVSLDS